MTTKNKELESNMDNNPITVVQNLIYEIRGKRVMLDFDLAKLYQIETKVLKQAVRRNIERFPSDFMFTLSDSEYNSLILNIRSQIVTLEKGRGKYPKYAPFAFTEQGVAMLSSVLNLKRIALLFYYDSNIFFNRISFIIINPLDRFFEVFQSEINRNSILYPYGYTTLSAWCPFGHCFNDPQRLGIKQLMSVSYDLNIA